MTRRLVFTGVVVGLLLVLTGTAGAGEDYLPFTQPVVDAADVVAPATEEQVGAELTDYETRSGNQIAVAVIDSTGNQSIEDYTIDLARAWGVGRQDQDTGILLVIAEGDRKLRIEVGRGLEGDLTDVQSGRIIRERLVPLLKQGDVDEAVVQGTRAIRTELGDTEVGTLPPALGSDERDPGTPTRWLFPAALVGFAALSLLRRRRGGRGGHGGRSGHGDALLWGAALGALGGFGGHGGRDDGFGGGGGGGFGGGGASGDW